MSKLAKAITAELKRDYQSPSMNFLDVDGSIKEIATPTYSRDVLVQIRASFGAELWVNERSVIQSTAANPITMAVEDVKRAVIEEIFGEFRKPLSELRIALYNRDSERARQVLRELEHQMFQEGL